MFVIGLAAPASAHYVYQTGWPLYTGADCVGARSEISHGTGGGYERVDVNSRYFDHPSEADCAANFSRPAGYLAMAYELYKWTGSRWAICRQTSPYWYYNTKSAPNWRISTYNGTQPPCGPGYYGTLGHSFMCNGSWKGGALWSGYHSLPA